jgi:superfamily II DNA helicase RecQ
MSTRANPNYVPVYARKADVTHSPIVTAPSAVAHSSIHCDMQGGTGGKSTPDEKKQRREQLLAALDIPSRARFERLRRVCLELARRRGWPTYFILSASNLYEVARLAPASLDQIAKIVGEKRATKYGQAFLDAIGSGGPGDN